MEKSNLGEESMLRNFGQYILFLMRLFQQMEAFSSYVRRTMHEAFVLGYKSLLIFSVVSAFLGGVTCIQTAHNMVNPLIPRYIIAVIVRDTAFLELAPTIMGLIFAGKVGSNIASELGTMRITEQIDALEVMGLNSVSYLVLPKILGSMLMFPVLVIFSMGFALLGGYVGGTITDVITPAEYTYGLRFDLMPFNIYFGLIKSVVFAFLISSISAFTGYYIRGGALEVGRASTRAVTSSCISILCADYFLADLLL